MRVLLIEAEKNDILFLHEALLEIGEGSYGNNWVNMEVLKAVCWTDAAAILSGQRVDIILLNLNTFRLAQRTAPDIPMIVLLDAAEESLGPRLLRDGAQDYLVKKQIDCAPLAHAMRSAIERHRVLNAARADSTHDSLTGLINRAGFITAVDRDRKLAERLGNRWMVLVAEIPQSGVEQQMDLSLVEAADHLRSIASPCDVLGRIDSRRLGMTIFNTDVESLEAAWTRIQKALHSHGIRIGAAIFSPDHPTTVEALIEKATSDLYPHALAMRN
jgi:GGDEF domain-containing protein